MFKKENKLLYIAMLIIFLISCILASLKLEWGFYVAGCLIGAICHYLMIIQEESFCSNDFTNELVKSSFNPKKSAILWYLAKMGIYLVGFGLVVLGSNVWASTSNVINVILAVIGYMTIKLMFIIVIQLNEKKVMNE